MKTARILVLLLILCILSLSLAEKCQGFAAEQNVVRTVDPRGNGPLVYLTIQEAINNATPGDTVFVTNGTYYENVVVDKTISLIGEGKDITIIDGRHISNVISILVDGIDVMGFHVQNSALERNNSAIRIDHANGNFISENIISDSRDGVGVYTSSNNTILNNVLTICDEGIGLYTSVSNHISNNSILGNFHEGIGLYTSNDNIISNNVISGNSDGMGLYTSNDNIISNNVISGNSDGMGLYTSSGNTVTANSINLNNYGGITLAAGSNNNSFYHNNLNNTVQVVSSESASRWDSNEEGNYWSDYNGTDTDTDGIGEVAYIINQNNRDDNPLMGQFSSYNVLSRKESYEIDIITNSTFTNFKFDIGSETGNRIIHFSVTNQEGTGHFFRIGIPNALMSYPSILLVGEDEIVPKALNNSDPTYSYLYFTYVDGNRTISLISSKTLYLLDQLLEKYLQLQATLSGQNSTYDILLTKYNILLSNFTQLEQEHNELNTSYQVHLIAYNDNLSNIRNLLYIFAATTAIFLVTTVYLSKKAHARPNA